MFFTTLREAVRRRKQAELDRDFWKAKAERLEGKIEERTDFFVEREFRLVDRILTKKGTFAITDEIRAKSITTNEDAERYALDAFLADKKEFLVDCAREAGEKDPEDVAARTFEQHRSEYIVDFQQQRIN